MTDHNQYLNKKVMNKWIIDQYVGRGQSGMVFHAHNASGEVAAVKIISIPNEQQIREGEIAYGGDPELMESFFEQIANKFVAETESLKKLSNSGSEGSQNIVRYIDHVASKKDMEWEITIIMEFVQPLKDYFAAHTPNVGSAVNLGIDIASGLEHCKSMNVIHRDIKDDNIFVDSNGNFKIGDFGVANMYTATRASTRVGTPYYMAPEVQNGSEYTANVDVYSLGIVLYKMLNYGRFPFAPTSKEKAKLLIDDNDKAFKRRMGGDRLPDPEFCPEGLAAIIRKACEFRPEDRYANASEMKRDLLAYRDSLTQEIWNTELPAPMARRKTAAQAPQFSTPMPGGERSNSQGENNNSKQAPLNPVKAHGEVSRNQNAQNSKGGNSKQTSLNPQAPQNDNSSNGGAKKQIVGNSRGNSYNNAQPSNAETDNGAGYSNFSGVGAGNLTAAADSFDKNFGIGNYNETQAAVSPRPNPTYEEEAVYDEANDPGMKTTAMIEDLMNQGGMNAAIAKKLAEKTRGQEKAEGEVRGLKRKGKSLKIGIGFASLVIVLVAIFGVYSWLNTYTYNANKDDNYYLYTYRGGVPKERIINKETGQPIPASYVTYDNGWIYFSLHDKAFSDDSDHRLYKINKDGSGYQKLSDRHCEYNIVFKDYIFFLDFEKNNTLCCIKIDGTDERELYSETPIDSMSTDEEHSSSDFKVLILKPKSGNPVKIQVDGLNPNNSRIQE